MIWEKAEGADGECLWGNMAFSKSTMIVMMARALGVTHIVESGRMGGLSLVHYHRLGFQLTSIERYPVDAVRDTLQRSLKSIRLLDGDGMRLVPDAVDDILRRDPTARVAAIIDGPKDDLAVQLAEQIRAKVALVVLDDQALPPARWRLPLCHSNDTTWRAMFPMKRDRALLVPVVGVSAAAPRALPFFDAREYFGEEDVATLALGDRWLPNVKK